MRARIFSGVAFLCVSASCCAFKPTNESFIGAGMETYQWIESAPDGSRYLKESGNRYLLTLTSLSQRSEVLDYDFRVDLYFGNVNYDGKTQSDVPALNNIPLYSTTRYSGARAEVFFNRNLVSSETQALGIMAGFGLDIWKRDLPNSYDVQGHYVIGYSEDYLMGYFKLGGVWDSQYPWHHKLAIGVKRPMFVDESISSPSINLNPNPTTTTYVTLRHVLPSSHKSGVILELFAERTHFNVSKPVIYGSYSFVQPDSDMRTTGIRLLFSF